MGYQPSFPEKEKRELSFILPLRERVVDFLSQHEPPFATGGFWVGVIANMLVALSRAVERFFDVELFIKAHGDELDLVDMKLKRFMHQLLKQDVIQTFEFKTPEIDWPNVIYAHYTMKSLSTENGTQRELKGVGGGSCALSYNDAAKKATAELLERYSLCTYDPASFVVGTFEQLARQNPINSKLFSHFSHTQLEDAQTRRKYYFDSSTIFRWTRASSLFDSRTYLVPAQLVYIFYQRKGEPVIRHTTTNGAAAGSSWHMAAYNAICESIERDAFMIFWLNKLTPPRVDLSTVKSPLVQKLLHESRDKNIEIAVFDITTDLGVPTFFSVVLNDFVKNHPMYIASATDLDVENAIGKVVVDSLKFSFWHQVTAEERERMRDADPLSIQTIRERMAFWSNRERRKEADFLFCGQAVELRQTNYHDKNIEEKLVALRSILKENNVDVYFADVTSPLAHSAGLVVLMSLIPALYPLYFEETGKYLGTPRLYEVPVRMGYLTMPKSENDMNPVPHPFL